MNLRLQKLSSKMVVSLTLIMVIVGVISSYVHVKSQESQLLNTLVIGADQLSGSITSATWHAMLADQRQSAYEIMQTIARKQGISRIRIFNREGRVMYSTAADDREQFDKSSAPCAVCHASSLPLVRIDASSRTRIYRSLDGTRKLGIVTPIYNEPSCATASCHAHPTDTEVLGVLDVSMDLSRVDRGVAEIQARVFIITGAQVLLMALFIILFTRRFVDAPIRKLIAGTKAVSAMQLDRPVQISSSDELGELAQAFDTMRVRLKAALAEVTSANQTLESRVEQRTLELEAAHRKLLHTDRLASLGQLSASVAHEINNPVSGILNLSMLMQRILTDRGVPPGRVEEFKRYLSQVIAETGRVGRIVQDLLAFSRRSKLQRIPLNLNSIVATTVNLLSHKLRLMNIAVELDLDRSLPTTPCDGSQMQQVLINLIMNGAEAAQGKEGGKVSVSTSQDRELGQIVLRVADNGDGIAPENLGKIFDPFFTTKEEGKGVGLGLAVVYGIVQGHRGEIDVQSTVGHGTTFTVRLPAEGEMNLAGEHATVQEPRSPEVANRKDHA